MLLDAKVIKEAAISGDKANFIDSIRIPNDTTYSKHDPFDFIYAKFKNDESILDYYYRSSPDLKHPFDRQVRLDILLHILQAKENEDGAGVSLRGAHKFGTITDYFPVPDPAMSENLTKKLLSWKKLPWDEHFIGEICNYWGEKIGAACSFKGNLTYWLLLPALVGIAFQISTLTKGNFSRPEIPVFGYFASLWIIFVSYYWYNHERVFYMQRGVYDSKYEVDETDEDLPVRPEFRGVLIKSYVNGQDIIYFHTASRRYRIGLSVVIMLLLICLMAAITGVIYYIRHLLYDTYVQQDDGIELYASQWLVSLINAVVIEVCNKAFSIIVFNITDIENHRTDAAYENAVIAKIFIFYFISNFCSFYWLAFGSTYMPAKYTQCATSEECLNSLAINHVVILGYRVFMKLFTHSFIPFIKETYDNLTLSSIAKCCVTGCCACLCEESYTDNDDCYCCDSCIDTMYTIGCYPPGCSDGQCRAAIGARKLRKCCNCTGKIKGWFRSNFYCCNPDGLGNDDDDDEPQGVLGKYKHYMKRISCFLCTTFADNYCKQGVKVTYGDNTTLIEKEFRKKHYDTFKEYTLQYMDQIMLIAYSSLFVIFLPAAPALVLVGNWFGVRSDVWRLLNIYRRPIPLRGNNSNTWHTIITILTIIICLTNAATVIYVLDIFADYRPVTKLLMFIAFQWTLLFIKYVMTFAAPSEPKEVRIQRKRAAFITNKLIDKQPDEVLDPLSML